MAVLLWGLVACKIQFLRWHCKIAMASGPNGYRMAPKCCAAMGGWGLQNSISEVQLPNCSGQWVQWGVGWCPYWGDAMRLGWLEHSMGGVFKLRLPLHTGQETQWV